MSIRDREWEPCGQGWSQRSSGKQLSCSVSLFKASQPSPLLSFSPSVVEWEVAPKIESALGQRPGGRSKFLTPWNLRVLVCKRGGGPSEGRCEEQRKLFSDSCVTVIPFLAKITVPSSVVSSPWLIFLPCQMVRTPRLVSHLANGEHSESIC